MSATKKTKHESKYRPLELHPTSLLVLNNRDRNSVLNLVFKLLRNRDQEQREIGLVLGLSFSLGLNPRVAMSLSINDSFNKDLRRYKKSIPVFHTQWKVNVESSGIMEPVSEQIELSIHPILTAELRKRVKLDNAKGKLVPNDKQDHVLAKLIQVVSQLRATESSHITIDRIMATPKCQLHIKYKNHVADYLLTGDTSKSPPHSRYYYVPSISSLHKMWLTTQEVIWTA